MVIESLLNIISDFLSFILNLLPSFPAVPERITNIVSSATAMIFNNAGLLGVFVSIDLIKIIIPLLLIVVSFEHIYNIVLWVVNKIPFLGID